MDVRIAREAAPTLMPPPGPIAGGTTLGVAVRTCAIRRPFQRPVAIDLVVDRTLADRFTRTCRWQRWWIGRAVPGAIVLAVLLGVVALGPWGARWPVVADGVLPVLAIALLAGFAVGGLMASPHHPRLGLGGVILLRGVHREAAYAWAKLNAPDAIVITD